MADGTHKETGKGESTSKKTLTKMKETIKTCARCPKCSICSKLLRVDISGAWCGHLFCNICFRKAVTANQRCPKCQDQLTREEMRRIHL